MKNFVILCFCCMIVSCASVENIAKLNRDTNISRNQISQAQRDIGSDYPLTHAQFITIKQLTEDSSHPSEGSLSKAFDKLTTIHHEFAERSQNYLSSVERQQNSWRGKKSISSKDLEWDSLNKFKEYSKREVKDLNSLYKDYKSYKNTFNKTLQNRDLISYTKQLPRNHSQARQILQNYEKEKNYRNYNKEILSDLTNLARAPRTDFESLVRLAQFLKQSEKNSRRYGPFPQSLYGPDKETQEKAAEIISSIINPNIVDAAISYASNQKSISDVAANLSSIKSSQFSDLTRYTSSHNLEKVGDIFNQRKMEILEESMLSNRRDVNEIIASNKSVSNKLQELVSLRNQFGNTYQRVMTEPIVIAFIKEMQQQRISLVKEIESQLIKEISAINSLTGMSAPLTGLFAQEDLNAPSVQRILQAQNQKLKSLTTFRPVNDEKDLNVGSFTTNGLNFESELMAIYLGDFNHARLEPVSTVTSALLSKYLYAYGKQCDAFLPSDKVAITESECAAEEVTRNGYGMVISRNCVRWREKLTGLYADPRLYSINNSLARNAGLNMLGGMLYGDPFAARAIADDLIAIGNDMNNLVSKNKCYNAGLERFENNLVRFITKNQPLLLPGKETLELVFSSSKVNLKLDNLDLGALLNDLIAENARGWMMNRYLLHSVGNIRVTSKSRSGKPESVRASYFFKNFGKRYRGDVVLNFKNDLPACLYFSDAPQTCRHPSRGIVNRYQRGAYVK